MENDQLTFGIDFDGTLARDPALFGRFIRMLHQAGHAAVLVTGRSDRTPHAAEVLAVMRELPVIPIVFAGAHWKRHAAAEAGHSIDIWVDDMPEYIAPQDPGAPTQSGADSKWTQHRPQVPGDYWLCLTPEKRAVMGHALGMVPPPTMQVWSLGADAILSAFWWEDEPLEDDWLEGAQWMPRVTPDDAFKQAEGAGREGGPYCKGSWAVGNNCKTCWRCMETKPKEAPTLLDLTKLPPGTVCEATGQIARGSHVILPGERFAFAGSPTEFLARVRVIERDESFDVPTVVYARVVEVPR